HQVNRASLVDDQKQTDAAQVCGHVRTLLTDGSYRTNLERMRNCFLTYTHKNRAVNLVEDLLREQPGHLMEVGPP
ncbi:MAG: hypothetical protein AAFX51_11780, partial [Cyanobacteria bacterium J06636_28]